MSFNNRLSIKSTEIKQRTGISDNQFKGIKSSCLVYRRGNNSRWYSDDEFLTFKIVRAMKGLYEDFFGFTTYKKCAEILGQLSKSEVSRIGKSDYLVIDLNDGERSYFHGIEDLNLSPYNILKFTLGALKRNMVQVSKGESDYICILNLNLIRSSDFLKTEIAKK